MNAKKQKEKNKKLNGEKKEKKNKTEKKRKKEKRKERKELVGQKFQYTLKYRRIYADFSPLTKLFFLEWIPD